MSAVEPIPHAEWRQIDRVATAVLAMAVILSYFLYLFNGSAFWDGTMLLYAYETGSYDALFEVRREQGSWPLYFVLRFPGVFAMPVLACRVIFLCCVLISAVMFYELLSVAARIPRAVALMMATFAVVLPFVPVTFEMSLIGVHVHIAAFLIGCRLLWRLSSETRSRVLPRLIVHVLFVESFFYGAFLMLGLLVAAADCAVALIGPGAHRRRARLRVLRWPDLHVLPFVFAIVKSTMLKPYGPYEGYNTVGPLTAAQVEALARVPLEFATTLLKAIAAPLFGLPGLVMVACLAGVTLVVLSAVVWRFPLMLFALAELRGWSTRARVVTGLVGLGFIYLTAVPFFLVGRTALYVPTADMNAYSSRDNMLLVFPMGLLLTVIVLSGRRGGLIRLSIAMAIALKLAVAQASMATDWLKEDVTLRLLHAALAQEINVRNAQVILYDDDTTRFNHLDWLQFAHLMRRAFGDESRIGLPPFEVNRCATLAACLEPLASTGHPSGAQALWGLRDAAGCGRAVDVKVEWASPAHRQWWQDFREAERGGTALIALARRRLSVSADPRPAIPCPSTRP